MKLLIIRHAKAQDRDHWQKEHKSDDDRPLVQEGIDEFTTVAKAISHLIESVQEICTSPLTRAKQTAEILHKNYSDAELNTSEILLPGTHWKDFHSFLLKQKWGKDHIIAVVGHENHLSHVLANLISCTHETSVRFKKGGAALVDLEIMEGKVSGNLLWFFSPKAVNKLFNT